MLAILAHSPGFMFEESIGSSNEIVSFHNPIVSTGILCNNLLKLNAFRAPVSKSFRIPMVPPVYIKRILAFEFIIVF
jgi:hypothetical protein